jgi:hypothetical protein
MRCDRPKSRQASHSRPSDVPEQRAEGLDHPGQVPAIGIVESKLTKADMEAAPRDSRDPKVRRFLGVEGNVGIGFRLPDTWAYGVLRQMGNYGELYERYLGKNGLGLDRGPNRLWAEGGMMISWLWQ